MGLQLAISLWIFALTALYGGFNFLFVIYRSLDSADLSSHSFNRFVFWFASTITTRLEIATNYLFSYLPVPILPVVFHEGTHNLIAEFINIETSWHLHYTQIEDSLEHLSDTTLYLFFLAPWLLLPFTLSLLIGGFTLPGWSGLFLFLTGVSMAYNTGPSFSDYSTLQENADNTRLPDFIINLIDLPCFLHLTVTSLLITTAYATSFYI